MKSYSLIVTYINPRKVEEKYTQTIGPVFTKKAINSLCIQLLKKRNCVGIETIATESTEVGGKL
jgi:hypothetical protein